MVKIRVLLFTALLIAIVGVSSGTIFGHHKHKKGQHCSYKGNSILGCFGYLARGINRKCDKSYDIFTDLASLKDVGDFDESISIILNVSKGGCGIIDYFIPKLGTIYSNMVISVFRIILCVIGHKHSKHAVCEKNHGHKWGWKLYDGGYDDIHDVIKCYDLYDPQGDIDKILHDFTKGKGRSSLSGTQKLIVQSIWDIACLFKRDNKKWCKNDLFAIFKKVATVTGALANSHRNGLGDYVIDALLNYCGKSFKDYGISDILTCDKDIKKDLQNCNKDNFNGAITYVDDDDENYTVDDDDDDNKKGDDKKGNNNNNNNNNGGNQSNTNANSVAQSSSNQNTNNQATNVVVNNYIVYKDEEGHEKIVPE